VTPPSQPVSASSSELGRCSCGLQNECRIFLFSRLQGGLGKGDTLDGDAFGLQAEGIIAECDYQAASHPNSDTVHYRVRGRGTLHKAVNRFCCRTDGGLTKSLKTRSWAAPMVVGTSRKEAGDIPTSTRCLRSEAVAQLPGPRADSRRSRCHPWRTEGGGKVSPGRR